MATIAMENEPAPHDTAVPVDIVNQIRSKIEEIRVLYAKIDKDDIAKMLLERTDPPLPEPKTSAATTVLTVITLKHLAKQHPMEYELLGIGQKWLEKQSYDFLRDLVKKMGSKYMARALEKNKDKDIKIKAMALEKNKDKDVKNKDKDVKNKDKDVKNKDKDVKDEVKVPAFEFSKAGFIDQLMLLKVRIAYAAAKKVRETALEATTAPSAA
jgi:hypothetical protein